MDLAQARLPLEKAEAWLEHFSRCSPCFRDFEQFQLQIRRRRRLFWQLTAAAAVVLSSSLMSWVIYSHQKAVRARSYSPAPISPLAQQHPALPLPATLHLEDILTSRDPEAPASTPPHLPLALMALSIYLPPGSEAGSYEIQVLPRQTGSLPVARFSGVSEIESGAAVLRSTPDLSKLEPGIYILAFRPTKGSWRYSRVSIP